MSPKFTLIALGAVAIFLVVLLLRRNEPFTFPDHGAPPATNNSTDEASPLIAARRLLIAENAHDPAPSLQLLALHGGPLAVDDIELFATRHPEHAPAAIAALTLAYRQGGDAALIRWWRRADVPPEVRAHLAYGLGVASAESSNAYTIVRQIIASPETRLRELALRGLAEGEQYLVEENRPRELTLKETARTKWLAMRLLVLDSLEDSAASLPAREQIQKIRDELLDDLARSQ